VPDANPAVADIYGLSLLVTVSDAHTAKRRSAIVQVQSDYVTALGRSASAPHVPGETLQSAADANCRLDKPGVFSFRFQHSVPYSDFANRNKCEYYGALSDQAAQELAIFWDELKYG